MKKNIRFEVKPQIFDRQICVQNIIAMLQFIAGVAVWFPVGTIGETLGDIFSIICSSDKRAKELVTKFTEHGIAQWDLLVKIREEHMKEMGLTIGERLLMLEYVHWTDIYCFLSTLSDEKLQDFSAKLEKSKEQTLEDYQKEKKNKEKPKQKMEKQKESTKELYELFVESLILNEKSPFHFTKRVK